MSLMPIGLVSSPISPDEARFALDPTTDTGATSNHNMSRASWLRPLFFGLLPVFAVALLLRLVVLHSQPRQLQSDEIDYDALGWSLASTGSYSIDGHPT